MWVQSTDGKAAFGRGTLSLRQRRGPCGSWAGGPSGGGCPGLGEACGTRAPLPASDTPPSPVRQQVQGEGPGGQVKSCSRCAAGTAAGVFVPLEASSPCRRGEARGLRQGLGGKTGTQQRGGQAGGAGVRSMAH